MVRLYENFKNNSESPERELTPLQYRAMQYADTGLPHENTGRLKCIRSEEMQTSGYGELIDSFLLNAGKLLDNG